MKKIMPEISQPDQENSKGTLALLVIAFSSWPFLSFLAGNKDEFIDLQVVAVVFAGCLLLLGLYVLVVNRLVSSAGLFRRLVNSGCIFFVLLFIYGTLDNVLKGEAGIIENRYILMTWTAVALAGFALTWHLSKSPHSTMVLSVAGSAMCVAAIFQIGLPASENLMPDSAQSVETNPAGQRPNVYYFIFDAYGRDDMFRKYLDFDTGDFLSILKKKGFKILEKSRTNYPETHMSISATLNMGPHMEPGKGVLDGYTGYKTLMGGHNNAVRMFRALGYTYAHAQPGTWGGTRCKGVEDICIRAGKGGINETGLALLAMTPLEVVIRRYWGSVLRFNRSFFPDVVKQIVKIRNSISGPLFTFSHTLLPHDRIYDKKCRIRYSERYFEEYDPPSARIGYINTVNCLNRQILDNLDTLLADDPEAIVVFLGDHGFMLENRMALPLVQWDKATIEMRYPILNAIRAPARCQSYLHPEMTAFNTFRFIEGCLRGKTPDYIADRSFLATKKEKDILPLNYQP